MIDEIRKSSDGISSRVTSRVLVALSSSQNLSSIEKHTFDLRMLSIDLHSSRSLYSLVNNFFR